METSEDEFLDCSCRGINTNCDKCDGTGFVRTEKSNIPIAVTFKKVERISDIPVVEFPEKSDLERKLQKIKAQSERERLFNKEMSDKVRLEIYQYHGKSKEALQLIYQNLLKELHDCPKHSIKFKQLTLKIKLIRAKLNRFKLFKTKRKF